MSFGLEVYSATGAVNLSVTGRYTRLIATYTLAGLSLNYESWPGYSYPVGVVTLNIPGYVEDGTWAIAIKFDKAYRTLPGQLKVLMGDNFPDGSQYKLFVFRY